MRDDFSLKSQRRPAQAARRACSCKEKTVEIETDSGELVCGTCGLVKQERMEMQEALQKMENGELQKQRETSERFTNLEPTRIGNGGFDSRGLPKISADAAGKGISKELKEALRYGQRDAYSHWEDRNKQRFIEQARRIASNLKAPGRVMLEVEKVASDAFENRSHVGRPRDLVCAAVVHQAYRKAGVARPAKDIAAAIGIDVSQLNRKAHDRGTHKTHKKTHYRKFLRYCRMIENELDMRPDIPEPVNYVNRIASQLGVSEKTQRSAFGFIGKFDENRLGTHRSPIVVAATALYLACQQSEIKEENSLGQEKICGAAKIREISIRNMRREWEIGSGLGEDMEKCLGDVAFKLNISTETRIDALRMSAKLREAGFRYKKSPNATVAALVDIACQRSGFIEEAKLDQKRIGAAANVSESALKERKSAIKRRLDIDSEPSRVVKYLRKTGVELGVSDKPIEAALGMAKKLKGAEINGKRSNRAAAAALLDIALERNGNVSDARITQEMIGSAVGLSPAWFLQKKEEIMTKLGISYNPHDPLRYVDDMALKLNVSEEARDHARMLAGKASDAKIRGKTSPLTVAAAAIDIACQRSENSGDRSITQARISVVANVSDSGFMHKEHEMIAKLGIRPLVRKYDRTGIRSKQ